MNITKIDPNFAVKDAEAGLHWYDAERLTVEGKGWADTAAFYDRLPARAKGVVPDPVWSLSQHSAGLCARFASDSPVIAARWKLRFESLAMHHMPSTGVSGLDLYVRHRGKWRWAANGIPAAFPLSSSTLLGGIGKRLRHYQLYLPLYNGVERVEIGIAPEAMLAAAAPRPERKPIVFYGTSIVQGGCASRPGMAHPSILGRWLDRPVINLGFSGNGRMEIAMADLLGEVDASAYVLDCLPNMVDSQVDERFVPFIERLRAARPATPIVLVENIEYQNGFIVADRAARTRSSNAAQRRAMEALAARGIKGLHLVPNARLLGSDGEATVDGTHFTDVGYLRMAKCLKPALAPLLTGG